MKESVVMDVSDHFKPASE